MNLPAWDPKIERESVKRANGGPGGWPRPSGPGVVLILVPLIFLAHALLDGPDAGASALAYYRALDPGEIDEAEGYLRRALRWRSGSGSPRSYGLRAKPPERSCGDPSSEGGRVPFGDATDQTILETYVRSIQLLGSRR